MKRFTNIPPSLNITLRKFEDLSNALFHECNKNGGIKPELKEKLVG